MQTFHKNQFYQHVSAEGAEAKEKGTTLPAGTAANMMVADASDLRLPPGEWPREFMLKDDQTGDERAYEWQRDAEHDGELRARIYVASVGTGFPEIHILND